jgi:hypothetical protein
MEMTSGEWFVRSSGSEVLGSRDGLYAMSDLRLRLRLRVSAGYCQESQGKLIDPTQYLALANLTVAFCSQDPSEGIGFSATGGPGRCSKTRL